MSVVLKNSWEICLVKGQRSAPARNRRSGLKDSRSKPFHVAKNSPEGKCSAGPPIFGKASLEKKGGPGSVKALKGDCKTKGRSGRTQMACSYPGMERTGVSEQK